MDITLRTERLLLRPLCSADLHSAHAYAGNPQNTKYMLYLPHESLEETELFLAKVTAEWNKENPRFFEFAIMSDDRHIGAISVYLDESRTEGEPGWIVHRDFWGMGYATEAASAIKDFSMNTLKLKDLEAHCDGRNTASYRLMEMLGMKLASDDKIRVYKDGREPARELKYSLSGR